MTRLPLYKKRFLLPLIFLVTSLCVILNQFYYYESRASEQQKKYSMALSHIQKGFENCQKIDGKSASACADRTIAEISTLYFGANVEVFRNGQSVLTLRQERHPDDRRPITIEKTIRAAGGDLRIEVTKLITPKWYQSYRRSMTFSVEDIVETYQKDGYNQTLDIIETVAWPRTRPVLGFLCLIAFIFFLFRQYSQSLSSAVARSETRLSKAMADYHRLLDEREAILAEKDRLLARESKYAQQQAHTAENLQKLEAELSGKNARLASLQEQKRLLAEKESDLQHALHQDKGRQDARILDQIQQLQTALQETHSALDIEKNSKTQLEQESKALQQKRATDALEIEQLYQLMEELEQKVQHTEQQQVAAQRNVENQRKASEMLTKKDGVRQQLVDSSLTHILLENPNVTKAPNKGANVGKHHSKDYIKKVADALSRNKEVDGLLTGVFSTEYKSQRSNRGTAQLYRCPKRTAIKTYCIAVYDTGDEGYAAEITLAAETEWESILQAKCILHTTPMLRGYLLKTKML